MTPKPNWDSVQLFYSGDDYFRSALEAIDLAENEIWIESYIFNMDPIGLRFLEALKNASLRGVRVHLLVDGVGSFNWLVSLKNYCQKNKIHFRIYHPLPIRLSLLTKISWRSLRTLLILLRRANKRNHRKIIFIDQKIAYLGSLNITQVHSREFLAGQSWRDTGVKVSGEPLKILIRACVEVWRISKTDGLSIRPLLLKRWSRLKQTPSAILRLNNRIRWRVSLNRDLNRRIKNAKTRIYITNAYFIPRRSILRSLRMASRRGVQVCLCLPAKTDVPVVRMASRSLYFRLMRSGVEIYEYQNRMLHAKTLIIDDWATVGSLNLNHRSLFHDLEIEIVLLQKEHIESLHSQWKIDLQNSHKINFAELGKMNIFIRTIAQLVYWMRYWI
jgi:cardiolipin synthase